MGCSAKDYPEWVEYIERDKKMGRNPTETQCPVYPDLEELLAKDGYKIERFYNEAGEHKLTRIYHK